MKNKVMHVVGARPNFVKAAPVIQQIDSGIEQILVHTGQHYDFNLSEVFFQNLRMQRPDEFLNIGSGLHGQQTAKAIIGVEKCLIKYEPDLLVVYGDINSTLGAVIAATKFGVKVAHIESGLRSFDRTMPEEVNRRIVDSVTDYHFVTEQSGVDNLLREGYNKRNIFFVGNTMIDSLFNILPLVPKKQSDEYILMTLHRPSNVDTAEGIQKVIDICKRIETKIVFPLHPRTKNSLVKHGMYDSFTSIPGMDVTPPVGYLDFVSLMTNSRAVITDSGGVQEETTALGIPCLTLRKNTERPSTVNEGTNTLVDSYEEIDSIIKNIGNQKIKKPILWDGKAGARVASTIKQILMEDF